MAGPHGGDIVAMTLPTLFVPHGGGPCFFMDPAGGPPDPMWRGMQDYLAGLLASLPERPTAILIVSGHWETDAVTLPPSASLVPLRQMTV